MNDPETYRAFMLDYAAGNLSESMAIAAAIHRLMSSHGDQTAQLWASVRAGLGGAASTDACRSRKTHLHEEVALDIIGTHFTEVRWQRALSGAQIANLKQGPGSLMRLQPDDRVFSHGHSTLEAMVVMEGALEDGRGIFETGELVLATPGVRHRPAAAGNKPCTCFVSRADTPFWRLT
jgi:anti-sigma factor ChrR (cupin superfamily)